MVVFRSSFVPLFVCFLFFMQNTEGAQFTLVH